VRLAVPTLSDEEGEMVLNPDGLLQLKVTATQDRVLQRWSLAMQNGSD
jgi:hypothetical protein